MSSYSQSISQAFYRNFRPGLTVVPFHRDDLFVDGIRIKNIGDVPHTYKVGRSFLPADIADRAPASLEWAILGTGIAQYKFTPVKRAYYRPDYSLPVLPMPEVSLPPRFEMGKPDEQRILSTLNRNNLVGAFLGCCTEHYQSHRRMVVAGYGQVEVDDLSLGTSAEIGEDVIVPICAKRQTSGKAPVLGWSQIMQDIVACQQLKPALRVRPVGVIATAERICLLEFEAIGNEIEVIHEKHYTWA